MSLVMSRSSPTPEITAASDSASPRGYEQPHGVSISSSSRFLPASRVDTTRLSSQNMQNERPKQINSKDLLPPPEEGKNTLSSIQKLPNESLTSEGVSGSSTESPATSPCSHQQLDPYREPQPLPNCKTLVFVYPYSSSVIGEDHLKRFPVIIRMFKQNLEQTRNLKLHACEVDYVLKMCGPSPEESHPSIIVFCTKAVFPCLRSLLTSRHIACQYHLSKSSRPPALLSKLLRSPVEDPGDLQMPRFKIYFWWAKKMPRILHWGRVEDIRVDQPCEDSLAKLEGLTMCGSTIAATDGVRVATLGCLVRVQSKLYGLSASHAFERIAKSTSVTIDISADRYLQENSLPESLSDGPDLAQTIENEYYLVDDVEYELDNEECNEESTASSTNGMDDGEDPPPYLEEQIMRGTIIFPSDEFDGTMPDLDWALIEVKEGQYQRPNAYIAVTGPSKPVFFSKAAPCHPGEQRDVVVISSALNPRRGLLLPGTSFLGGINRPNICEVWNIVLPGEQELSKGDSGSLVIDVTTNEIYGHVVASNPLGEAYVVPLVAILAQIKEFFKTDDVSLPEPLPLLSRLTSFYFEASKGYETKPSNQAWMIELIKAFPDSNESTTPSAHLVGDAQHISAKQPPMENMTANSSISGVYELANDNFGQWESPSLHAEKDFLSDLDHECYLCEKKLSIYDARQCSYCGGRGDQLDPFYCVTCKEEGCGKEGRGTRFCTMHETCWDNHLPKYPKAAQAHQMVDPLSQLFVETITHSEADPEKQQKMHQRDEQARWFNMRRDHTIGKPELYVYDRFIQLCDPTKSGNRATKRHYPSFVSFVGDTSVGKSTLVRAMLLMGIVNTSQFLPSGNGSLVTHSDDDLDDLVKAMKERGKDVPVTRSGNINHLTDPTTLGVHLYLDKGTTISPSELGDPSSPITDAQYPILFSDCEGFGAGDAMTNAERAERTESDTPDVRGRELGVSRNRSPSRLDELALQLQVKPNCYSRGKEGVDLFYARFLYAISDVVVFITKEDQRIQSELVRVLEWASRAVHKSVNHPSRKTLIIVRHMANVHEPSLYEAEKLKRLYLYSHKKLLWEDSAILKEFVNYYNNKPETMERYDLRITNNDSLYKALFNNITCCYIPNKSKVKGRPGELYTQYRALRDLIESSVRDGLNLREESVMQYNVPALSHILTRAFEHFAASEKPFDFYLAARRDNPNPQSMQDHIANFLRHAFECGEDIESVNRRVSEVTSVALLIYTYRNFRELAPNPTEIFDRDLYDIWIRAIEKYRNEYEKCAFRFRDGQPCTSRPWQLHQQHTSAKGQFLVGSFQHEREWNSAYKSEWVRTLRTMFLKFYEKVFIVRGRLTSLEKRLATARELSRNSHWKFWRDIKSNKTCLSCLQAVPNHVLSCGHAYCPRCVQELGLPSTNLECAWDMQCWLCWESQGQRSHLIQLKPRCAGARILTLDGGGIRGIVELSVLQALHSAVGLENYPIREMFDLIVGTSTGGIISLCLAMSNISISEIMKFFSDVSKKTFSRTTAGSISRFNPMKKVTTYALMAFRLAESVFPSEPLEDGLKKFFNHETSLFASALLSQSSATRVAVTSAKDLGETTCLITSYNHPLRNPASNLEREEDSEKDMKIWEAALATSAAPFYLPPFEKRETNTKYVDGAVYANCPAEVAYGEMEKLWPDKGTSLDFLVSLGTGDQKVKDDETPTLLNLGFVVSIRAMFQRQLDSKSSWTKFEKQTAPQNIRSRLYRLDPPLKGDHVELYEYKRLQELQDSATGWTKSVAAARIQEIANTLIANLFFFEPDDLEAGHSPVLRHSHLSDPSYNILAGSIRCRLSHGSPQLEKLLGEMVEGFSYAQMASDNTADVGRVQNWSEVEHPLGQHRLLDVMVSETQPAGHAVRKFRLPYTFVVKKNNSMFHILAVKLKRSEKKIAISGFPSTIDDLQRRSKMKWLQ